MQIINILEIENGIPSMIRSLPIQDEQNEEDVVEQAETIFKNLVWDKESEFNGKKYYDENIEDWLDAGNYDNQNGYEVLFGHN